MRRNRPRVLLIFTLAIATTVALAEPSPDVVGHWEGAIEIPGAPIAIKIDLSREGDGWDGTIDIPAQGGYGLPLTAIRIETETAEFAIANIPGEPKFHGTITEGSIRGKFTQGGQGFPFSLAREARAAATRPQDPRPPFPYDSKEVRYTNGEDTLAGTLTVPHGEGPFPVALLISGSGLQDRDSTVFEHRPFRVLADHLGRAGIAVLRVDDRGVGGSTGDPSLSTSEDFAADVRAGVEFLKTRSEIDTKSIGLIGHSEGGSIAPFVAAGTEDVVFVVLLAAPAVPGTDLLVRQNQRLFEAAGLSEEAVVAVTDAARELFDRVVTDAEIEAIRSAMRKLIEAQMGPGLSGDALDQTVAREAASMTTPWFRYFLAFDPRPYLKQVGVPVLALNGALDLQVDSKQNLPQIEKALREGGNTDVEIRELPGLNHLFQTATTGQIQEYYGIEETISPDVLEIIRGWIAERFVKRSAS